MATTLTACEQAALDLAEAKRALHSLTVLGRPVRITHADKTVEYATGKRDDLLRYVALLQDQVDACNGVRTYNRAFRVKPSGW